MDQSMGTSYMVARSPDLSLLDRILVLQLNIAFQ